MTESPAPELPGQGAAPASLFFRVFPSLMLPMFLGVVDQTIVATALPAISGSLGDVERISWIVVAYLITNTVAAPVYGRLGDVLGRRRMMFVALGVMIAASAFCAAATSILMLTFARVLQGIGGGGMQPLAQSILLESFPPHQHGTAMAVYGMGIVVAPVIGPTLGGWITDSYSWRWIFYINLPVGFLALFMANLFIEDPPYLRQKFLGAIDYLGFGLMAVWLGTLQLVLDKGQEADWFATGWIRWTVAASVIALAGFILREFMSREPIVQLRILADRNFAVGTLIAGLYGFVLYGMTALLPLFLQTLLGYPALDSGLAVSPRGIGSIVSMLMVGVLVNYVDGRILLACGFGILGYSTFLLSRVNLDISMASVVVPNLMNGFAGGFIFVPLTTMAMGRLRKQQIGNAAGIYNLMRNIGGSVGIASVTTLLVRGAQVHQSYLAGNLTAGNPATAGALQGLEAKFRIAGASGATAHAEALGALYHSVQQQASVLAYADNFRLLAYLSLLCILPILFFHRLKSRARERKPVEDDR